MAELTRRSFWLKCRRHSKRPEDALATATALTAETIASSYKRFVFAKMRKSAVDYIVSGGGARNATLMAMLAQRLEPLGCELAASEEFGLPAEAKEAAAFALLAWQTWHRLPGNVPAATGAAKGSDSGPGDVCVSCRRLVVLVCLVGCHSAQRDPNTVVFLIESSPANLDPRIGTDAQSQRIDALLFDGLVDHDASFQFMPALGRELGAAGSADARLSSAQRSSLSGWTSADRAGCGLDHQLDPEWRGDFAKSRGLRVGCIGGGARRSSRLFFI